MHDPTHDVLSDATPDPMPEPADGPDERQGASLRNLPGAHGRLAPVAGGRHKQLLLRFTPDELDEVKLRAQEYGLEPAAFAHVAARFFKPRGDAPSRYQPAISPAMAQALAADLAPIRRSLTGSGTNLNQLAMRANAGDPPSAAEIAAVLGHHRRILTKLDNWMDQLDPQHRVHRPHPSA
jgi:hypothetical protein